MLPPRLCPLLPASDGDAANGSARLPRDPLRGSRALAELPAASSAASMGALYAKRDADWLACPPVPPAAADCAQPRCNHWCDRQRSCSGCASAAGRQSRALLCSCSIQQVVQATLAIALRVSARAGTHTRTRTASAKCLGAVLIYHRLNQRSGGRTGGLRRSLSFSSDWSSLSACTSVLADVMVQCACVC